MLIHIIIHELRRHILSLRLHIALLLTLTVFSIGSISFVRDTTTNREEYRRYQADMTKNMRKTAESNLSQFAVQRKDEILEPRGSAFIDDARERYLPDLFEYNAYNVFGYDVRPGSTNPYLESYQELNWMFIVSIIICFTVFLLTFDLISGEKETKTLAGTLANPVSRGTLLFGKYLGAITATVLSLVPGLCVSLIVVLVSGAVSMSAATVLEIAGFIAAAAVFVACIAAFGMLASVISRSSNVSLLIALSLWLVFVAIVPNTALFWAQTLFPIEKADVIAERISKAREEINNSAPEGSWASSDNQFLPQHELRAANQTNLMNSEKRIRDAYYQDRFRQVERVRLVTVLSPVSLFEYISEAIVGGGYLRFQKNWNDLHMFQGQFLTFFKDKDAADPESPHWYNPYEDYSTTRKPVKFEEVPRYRETPVTFAERFSHAGIHFLTMMLYTVVVFFLTFSLFTRYDVR